MKKITFFSFILISSICFFFSCTSTPKNPDIIPQNNQEIQNQTESSEEENKTQTEDNQNSETSTEKTENNNQSKEIENTETDRNPPDIAKEPVKLSRNLLGKGIQSAQQLADFFLNQNPDFTREYIENFAGLYISEATTEHINWDVAFAQMCLETGFLRFGGLVQPEWHNYCGLGAIDADNPGCIFETEQMGVRAHIQHLQAYATTEEISLINNLIDPRYNWVHKTKFAENIEGLTGTWAADPNYSIKLENILCRMEDLLNK